MAKFHIGRGGKAAICSARKGKCPYGSEEEHFKTREEAHEEAQKILLKNNNILAGKKKDREEDNKNNSTAEILEIPKTPYGILGNSELDEQGKEYARYVSERIIQSSENGDTASIMDEELYNKTKELPYGDDYWLSIYNEIQKNINEKYYGKDYVEATTLIMNRWGLESDKTPKLLDSLENYKDITKLRHKIIDKLLWKNNNISNDGWIGSGLQDKIYSKNTKIYDMGDDMYIIKDTLQEQENPRITLIHAPDGLENVIEDTIRIHEPHNTAKIPDKFGFNGMSAKTVKMLLESEEMMNNASFYAGQIEGYEERWHQIVSSILEKENKKYKYKKQDHKNLSIGKATQAGNTILEKHFDVKIEKTGNVLLDGKMCRTGIIHTTEKQVQTAKNIANNEKIAAKIENLKSKKYGNTTGTKRETHNSREAIKKLSEEEKEKLTKYSSLAYKSYSARAHGYDNYNYGFAKVSEDEVMKLNSIIKKIEKESRADSRFLYRGSKLPSGMTSQELLDKYTVGDVVITNKITSTTRSGKVMNDFSDGKHLDSAVDSINYIYNTKKGAYISSISRYTEEKEVLIGIGEKMIVIDKGYDKSGKPFIVFADSQEE